GSQKSNLSNRSQRRTFRERLHVNNLSAMLPYEQPDDVGAATEWQMIHARADRETAKQKDLLARMRRLAGVKEVDDCFGNNDDEPLF
ncbi:MAG: hypothetical protein ACREOZ_00965, partial [Gloeomargaritales cyanobacterium]